MGESDEKRYSLISIGDWSEPAKLLVEKISDAIGGIAKPWQIKRVAQAEIEAERIRAEGEIKITELHRRAARRFLMEEAKKQQNMESIISLALPEVGPEAKSQKVEDDWIANFFDKCRLISDEEMQRLWAKVLAGEANSPGRFSKRTVNLVSVLDKSDAHLFTRLCSFGLKLSTDEFFPLVYDKDHEIYTTYGINFGSLSHLAAIGLIHFDSLRGYVRQNLGQEVCLDYFDQRIWIRFQKADKNVFNAGQVLLTQAGRELATICTAGPCNGFIDYTTEKWRSFGYNLEPPVHLGPEES